MTESISPEPSFEIINLAATAAEVRVALFDFDGTLSLLRAGWANVMVPMMVEELAGLKSGESETEIESVVREFVDRLTGKQTVYQMIELGRQVELRGGLPKDPLAYKRQYLDLLGVSIEHRLEEVRTGQAAAQKYLVPGSIEILQDLRARGLRLYLASGTDEQYMKMEADLLGVTPYFDGGVYGALDAYKTFSKRILIQKILDRSECHGQQILGFGDGYVEIENVKDVGGVAIGVASDEGSCLEVDTWKRERLTKAGADGIIPNYLQWDMLAERLFSK